MGNLTEKNAIYKLNFAINITLFKFSNLIVHKFHISECYCYCLYVPITHPDYERVKLNYENIALKGQENAKRNILIECAALTNVIVACNQ